MSKNIRVLNLANSPEPIINNRSRLFLQQRKRNAQKPYFNQDSVEFNQFKTFNTYDKTVRPILYSQSGRRGSQAIEIVGNQYQKSIQTQRRTFTPSNKLQQPNHFKRRKHRSITLNTKQLKDLKLHIQSRTNPISTDSTRIISQENQILLNNKGRASDNLKQECTPQIIQVQFNGLKMLGKFDPAIYLNLYQNTKMIDGYLYKPKRHKKSKSLGKLNKR